MNRRHFLKFLPLIPVAVAFVKLPRPAESNKLTSIEDIIARQKALAECMERSGTIPAPANGHSYDDEEVEIIKPYTRWWIEKKLDEVHLRELLHQKVMEILAGATPQL